jgi:hypothetical protein
MRLKGDSIPDIDVGRRWTSVNCAQVEFCPTEPEGAAPCFHLVVRLQQRSATPTFRNGGGVRH